MGVLSDVGLSTARALEQRLGPRLALRVLVPMIVGSEPSATRAAATVVALGCAADAGDPHAIQALAQAWALEHTGARTADIAPVCARIAARHPDAALALADAEVARQDHASAGEVGAEARALRATIHERRGAWADAVADWRSALAAAERARATADVLAVRVELARLLARHPGRRLEAAEVVATVPDDAPLEPRGRLLVALARLGAPGRYARVRGLDALVELASGPDPEIARAAIRAACAHVDRSGRALTEVELERVQRAARLWPDEAERGRVSATLEALGPALDGDAVARSAALARAAASHRPTRDRLERARAVLSGGAAPPRAPRDVASWCALAAVAALRAGRDDEARARLRELRAAGVEEGEAGAWTAAWLGLERSALREDATALAEALLATRGEPPRGFQHLALRLERAGADALALRAWARAHEQRESGAHAARTAALVRAAWRAAGAGRREDAIAWLTEARALATALGG